MHLFIKTSIMLFLCAIIFSCDSGESISPKLKDQYTETPTHISFADKAAFESFVTKPNVLEKTSSFISLADISVQENGMPIRLKRCLNKDSIVQIGDYLIKVRAKSGTVSTIPVSHKSYLDLAGNNFSNKNIKTFKASQPVLSLLFEPQGLGICTDYSAVAKMGHVDPSFLEYQGSNGNTFTASISQEYVQFGIYFELSASISNLTTGSPDYVVNPVGYSDLVLNYSYAERCSGVSILSPDGGLYISDDKGSQQIAGTVVDNDNRAGIVNSILYSGTAGLKSFSLSTTGRYIDNSFQSNGGPLPSYTLPTISDVQ